VSHNDTLCDDALAAEKIRAGFKPKTVNNILSVLHTSLVTAVDWGMLRSVPRLHWRRVPEPRYRVLTDSEERALLSVVPDGFWRALIIFFLHTGTRFSEAAAVRWEDLDLNRDTPIVHICRGGARGIPGDTKTGSHRDLPLTQEVVAELSRLPHVEERIFPKPSGGMMDPGSKASYLYRFCDWAGVKRFGWHSFRHTFATRMAAAGVPVHVLQRLLGHTTIKMTTRYVHVDQATLTSTVNTIRHALPIPGRFGHQVDTKPRNACRRDVESLSGIRIAQHKTDPVGSACAWSG
jgi:integrase